MAVASTAQKVAKTSLAEVHAVASGAKPSRTLAAERKEAAVAARLALVKAQKEKAMVSKAFAAEQKRQAAAASC